MISKYDEWKTKTPRDSEKIIGLCDYCDREIYDGVPYYNTNEGRVHDDCFEKFAKEVLQAELTSS
jgi:hypothetical protein